MKTDGIGEVGEDRAVLLRARLSDSEEACGGNRAGIAAATKGSFAPLNGAAERPFGGVVGRFDAFVVDERE